MSILGQLETIVSQIDDDSAFLVAAAVNLYNDALRRKGLRVLYTPSDAKNLLLVCTTILKAGQTDQGLYSYQPPARSPELTEDEQRIVLEGAPAGEMMARRA